MTIQQLQQDAYNLGILTGEAQVKDIYTWRAVYEDGQTCVTETAENSFANVDQSRVKAVLLLPLQGGSPHRVDIPEGAQAIFFRRRAVVINPNNGENTQHPTVHCIGWKTEHSAVYLFAFDDGSVLLTDNLQAVI